MTELKPCPFCGCEAEIVLFLCRSTIACKSCMAAMLNEEWQGQKEKLIEAWNRRKYYG